MVFGKVMGMDSLRVFVEDPQILSALSERKEQKEFADYYRTVPASNETNM